MVLKQVIFVSSSLALLSLLLSVSLQCFGATLCKRIETNLFDTLPC